MLFTDATYAYQGSGRGLDMDWIALLANKLPGQIKPDLTLLLDLPVEMGLKRADKRSAPDRFESENLSFFQHVRQGYLDIAQQQPERVKKVNAAQTFEQVRCDIEQLIEAFIDASR